MNTIAVGSIAPEFALKDNRGQIIELDSYKGQKVLLSWHPLSWTKLCSEQVKAIETNLSEFTKYNTVPLCLSVDPYPAKNAWAKELGVANVKLLSDFWPHGAIANEYGLFDQDNGFSKRANVIVDKNGIVVWVKVYDIAELPDIKEVIAALRE